MRKSEYRSSDSETYRPRENQKNYRDDYRLSYRDRSPAYYRDRSPAYYRDRSPAYYRDRSLNGDRRPDNRDRSTDRYPQMSRGDNCSKVYSIEDRFCDKCGSIEHHAFDCRKYRRWSSFDCKKCNLGRRHWPEDCFETEANEDMSALSAADTVKSAACAAKY